MADRWGRPMAFLLIAAAAMVAALSGCQSAPSTASHRGPAPVQAERGRAVAQSQCGACHALDMASASPRAAAPPFRDLRIRFNTVTWEREMARIATGDHFEMPPQRVDASDASDLHAFLQTLR